MGSALLESKECLLRLAYTHTHALQQQQQRQEMEFVLGVIVMVNQFFVQKKLCTAASRAGLKQFAPLRST